MGHILTQIGYITPTVMPIGRYSQLQITIFSSKVE